MRTARLLLACTLAGCTHAAALPNDWGGHTLYAHGKTVQHAIIRFERSARDLCPGGYVLTPLTLVSVGPGSVSYLCELTCTDEATR